MKILFIVKERSSYCEYGGANGLSNSARFIVEFLNSKHIEAQLEFAIDANDIDRLVDHYQPTHVIIEALWVTPEKLFELIRLHPKVKWVVRIHSRLAFLANEGIAFSWLKKLPVKLAFNTKELARDIKKIFGLKTVYLPNIYTPIRGKKTKIKKHWLDIGCFGAIRPMKNHLTQAVAAIKFADAHGYTMHFHVNARRLEQGGVEVLKNLRIIYKLKTRTY